MGNYSSSVFLPRQSFFSCHDNALVKHGLNPHTLSPLECRRRYQVYLIILGSG